MSRNNNNSANRLLRSIDQEYIDSLGGLALSPEELCHYFDLDLEFVKDVEMALLKTGNYQKVGVVDPDGTEITERLQMTSLYVNTIKSDLILATLPKIEAQTIVALMKMINQNISPDDVIFQQGKHVIRLTLSSLELSEIPEDIGCFANLKLLDLSNNNLSKLPESVSNLSALETLDLSGNRIRTLPKSLNRLTNLKNINL